MIKCAFKRKPNCGLHTRLDKELALYLAMVRGEDKSLKESDNDQQRLL